MHSKRIHTFRTAVIFLLCRFETCLHRSYKDSGRFKGYIILFLAMALSACTAGSLQTKKTTYQPKESEIYIDIHDKLEDIGDIIDYDTLMYISKTMINSPRPIPHVDQLVHSLMNKRNQNPRVDQMILIFSAMIIGKSRFPVPNAQDLFESIICMDDTRVNHWVIAFLGGAIGDYNFDLPDGDGLVDLLEQRTDQIDALPKRPEYFGTHFLPPPKSPLISAHIAGIEDQKTRELERVSYYSLIINNYTEEEIEAGIKQLNKEGTAPTGEPCRTPLYDLLSNRKSKTH